MAAEQRLRGGRKRVAKPRTAAGTSRERYIGETKNQLRHGYGVYNYENKFFRYEGQWENGLKHGHGKLLLGDGGHYEGTFVKGEMEGHGYRVFGLSGNIYTGQFVRGEPHGQGLMRTPAGEQYEGGFMEGRREGFGTLSERDGACYEGDFHGNRRHGEGYQVYANGDQYNGDWVKGRRHGHGILRCSNGTTYEGQWRGGVYHGEGTISHCSGVSYSGLWANGKPAGEAVGVRLAGGGGEVVIVQGDRFTIQFECVDSNGSITTLESGRSFRVSAAIQKKAVAVSDKSLPPQQPAEDFITTPFGYEAAPYELLQMPQSTTDSSQSSSQTTPADNPGSPLAPPPPAQPLQLGQLTRELYQLHSSSTHSLSKVSARDEVCHSSLEPTTSSTKSLQDLTKFADEDTLDSYTTPSTSIMNGGTGTFRELFLPPPIIPLPEIKKKRVPQSSSLGLKSREKQSRTPSPGGLVAESGLSQSLESESREAVAAVESSTSLLGDGRVSISSREGRGGEGDLEKGKILPQSKAAKKLLQKRAKFCKPGTYVVTVTEVTCPPFLDNLLPPLHIEVHVVSQKSRKNNDSPLSNLIHSKSKLFNKPR